jgi:cell division protein ZipA
MDNFRWILLAVGILFIIIVYLISRKNKRDFYQDDEVSEDLPEINATHWDDLDEGVGEVRIIARNNDDIALDVDRQPLATSHDETYTREAEPFAVNDSEPVTGYEAESELEPEPPAEDRSGPQPEAESELAETVLVLNILAREGSNLSGKSINSVAHASNMAFGEMNIYHRMDENNQPLFSMVNMVKPGSFDPATIHELQTPGISLFMQLPGPSDASDAFNEMLQTAHRMAEVLEARLCDRRRQPMTEAVAEEYRNIAASFDGKN